MSLRTVFFWTIILALGLLIWWVPVPSALAGAPSERVIRIQASRFAYSPHVMKVNRGDRVTFDLEATDVVHGLSIDSYGLETFAEPGRTARLTFDADRVGTFRFHCTVTCGNMHPFMTGKIQVGNDYVMWRVVSLAALVMVAGVWGWRR